MVYLFKKIAWCKKKICTYHIYASILLFYTFIYSIIIPVVPGVLINIIVLSTVAQYTITQRCFFVFFIIPGIY